MWVWSWVGKIPWRRAWQPTPVFLPGDPREQRSLAGYTVYGVTESDMSEATEPTCLPWRYCANRRTPESSLPPSYRHLIYSEIKCRLRLTVLISINFTNPNSVETAIMACLHIFLLKKHRKLLFHKKGKQIICINHIHLLFSKVPPLWFLLKFYILLNVEFL